MYHVYEVFEDCKEYSLFKHEDRFECEVWLENHRECTNALRTGKSRLVIRHRTDWDKAGQEVIDMMFEAMPEEKKQSFRNACTRNFMLTSWYGLEHWTVTVYKEGFYIEADGCRSRFAAWAFDNDGELVFGRKPKEDKLSKLWGATVNCGRLDHIFDNI